VPINLGGHTVIAAVEDMGRLRDALGVQPPAGIPFTYLEPVPDPLGDVVGRYARTHIPFTARQAAAVLQLPTAVVETVLQGLEAQGRLSRGSFLRGGSDQEWVDEKVLKRLKRRSLATLRKEVEPVDQERYAAFAPVWQGVSTEPPRGINALNTAVDQLQGAVIPASVLERDVLKARLADPADQIDRLLLSGDLAWVGRGALGSRDGRLSLFRRDTLETLWTGADPDHVMTELQESIHRHLSDFGASFFRDMYNAAGGGEINEVTDALWDLVWAGYITNDTMEPVRAFVSRRRGSRSGRQRLAARFPAHTSGRWSLVQSLVESTPSPTERHSMWAQVLLERHGVVARTTALAENYPGGFSALYPVYSHLEETGRLRRGYFIEGLGGSQFALPGAVDRLRAQSKSELMVLAATDPANPYGGAIPWPAGDGRLARDAGAYVFLYEGRLVGFLDKGRRGLNLLERDVDLFGTIGRGLAEIAARHRRLTLITINDDPAPKSPLAPVLGEWGFAPAPKGLTYKG
jgi:ATP-dependent Lhr-like helicase